MEFYITDETEDAEAWWLAWIAVWGKVGTYHFMLTASVETLQQYNVCRAVVKS